MNFDKTILKRQIDQSRPNELIILAVNKFEKNSLHICQKEIDRFINKMDDYVIIVMKK